MIGYLRVEARYPVGVRAGRLGRGRRLDLAEGGAEDVAGDRAELALM